MSGKTRVCPYCGSANPEERRLCLACGAPLDVVTKEPLDLEPKVTVVRAPAPEPTKKKPSRTQSDEDLKKVTDTAEKVYNTALYTYSVAWRTAAEAIAIALVALIIGIIGGATGMQVFGILGAAAVGLAVGYVSKRFYLTLLSAPAGALVGLGLSGVLWALSVSPKAMVFMVTAFGIIGAVIGGHRHNARYPAIFLRIQQSFLHCLLNGFFR